MKQYIFTAATIATLATTMIACSKDDDKNSSLPELENEITFSGKKLDLEYSDEPMSGKSVKLVKQGNNCSLVLYSEINLAELSSALSELPVIAGPGIIPGSPELIIPVQLKPDGDEYDFEGNYSTEYASFHYSGDIKSGMMELDIDNVKMKNTTLGGTSWAPLPFQSSLLGSVESTPVYINWQTDGNLLPVANIDITPNEVLNLLASLPLIPVYNNTAKTSVGELVSEVLKTVGFRSDGNVIINYVNTSFGAAQLATFPQNMLQYVVLNNSEMLLYPNPVDVYSQILNNNSRAGANSSLDSMFLLAKDVLPMIANGFPVNYQESNSNLTVTIGNEVMLPIFKNLAASILEDPVTMDTILATLEAHPEMEKYSPIIKGALQQLPELIEKTTKLEIGLRFRKY